MPRSDRSEHPTDSASLPTGLHDDDEADYDDNDNDNAWVKAAVCEQLSDRLRYGEKRAWKTKRVVQGAKFLPVSRRYLV